LEEGIQGEEWVLRREFSAPRPYNSDRPDQNARKIRQIVIVIEINKNKPPRGSLFFFFYWKFQAVLYKKQNKKILRIWKLGSLRLRNDHSYPAKSKKGTKTCAGRGRGSGKAPLSLPV
jgi:hypothetical protein